MINKNVYLLFPPGYHGNYVKWAIESADIDSAKSTVIDPINYSDSKQFGGVGTSHLNPRVPTHQNFRKHQQWVILNRPTESKVYIINSCTWDRNSINSRRLSHSLSEDITDLLFEDKTGIVIVMHDNNDEDIASYAKINCVTKWPMYLTINLKCNLALHDQKIKDIDVYSSNRELRNFLVESSILSTQEILNKDILQQHINVEKTWFQLRNSSQPHEVDETTYLSDIDSIDCRVFQINCRDVVDKNFIEIFKNIMQQSKIIDNWNTSTLHNIHQSYIDSQPNLQWFESLQHWKDTGVIDAYLNSHAAVEAEIIRRILNKLNINIDTDTERDQWLKFYADIREPHWPEPSDGPSEIFKLPDWIQQEIIQDPASPLKNKKLLNSIMDWRNMSLFDINQVYQKII